MATSRRPDSWPAAAVCPPRAPSARPAAWAPPSLGAPARAPAGALSNVATVSLTISPVNDPPVAVNDSYSTNEDTPLTVPAVGVLGNDRDVDGDPLSAVLVTNVSHGTLTFNTDGSFRY